MAPHTDDLRIRRIDALVPPAELIAAARARRRSLCGPSRMFWSLV